MEGGGKIYDEDRGSNGEERSKNMGIRGRKEGGEGDPFTLGFWRSFGRAELQRRGFVGDCFWRGYNSLGLVLGLGSGVQRGTFGAGWSARPRQLAGWQN